MMRYGHHPQPRRPRHLLLAWLLVPLMGTTTWGLTAQSDPNPNDPNEPAPRAEKERPERGGFGGGRRARGPGQGYWNRMSQSEKDEVWAFMEEYFPRMFIELQRANENSPQRVNRRMGWMVHDLREMMDLMDTQPERALLMIQERKAHFEMRRAVRQYRRASNPEGREKAREMLREQCAEAFDARHARREMDIRELEVRIDELKQRHAEAAKMRAKLIDQEMNDMLKHRPGHRGRGPHGRPGPPPHDEQEP